ncbi:MAG TPA: SDR family oxidoreductase [Sporosarcina sp.]|nr:SDR family oxidoreductase [Sporosarcina sp.]
MKRALVLGATGGIGQSISHQLARDGWSLYLHYNQQQATAHTLRDELKKLYPTLSIDCVGANFLEDDAADKLAKKIEDVQAIVVSNGQSMTKLLTETTTVDMDALWKVHVRHPARLISLLSNTLRQHDISYIVFIGSIWGNTGAAGEVMYSAVKGAQHAFVKAYAKEASYAGVRVNAIAPGWIETKMNDTFSEEDKQFVLQEIPLLRTGYPEEIANLVSFLTSGKADYMTGDILKVNGGWYI